MGMKRQQKNVVTNFTEKICTIVVHDAISKWMQKKIFKFVKWVYECAKNGETLTSPTLRAGILPAVLFAVLGNLPIFFYNGWNFADNIRLENMAISC